MKLFYLLARYKGLRNIAAKAVYSTINSHRKK